MLLLNERTLNNFLVFSCKNYTIKNSEGSRHCKRRSLFL